HTQMFFSSRSCVHTDLHSFPTRRSSDLTRRWPSPLKEMLTAFFWVSWDRASVSRALRNSLSIVGLRKRNRWTSLSLHERMPSERSEEHTSELQSLRHLVCRLLLEKKKEM